MRILASLPVTAALATLVACGGAAAVASSPSSATTPDPVTPAATTAAPAAAPTMTPVCDSDKDPCPAPDATQLPAAGTLCFQGPIMFAMVCATPDQTCASLHDTAISMATKAGTSKADAEKVIGTCTTDYSCFTKKEDDGTVKAHCYSNRGGCVQATLGQDSSGCVDIGHPPATPPESN